MVTSLRRRGAVRLCVALVVTALVAGPAAAVAQSPSPAPAASAAGPSIASHVPTAASLAVLSASQPVEPHAAADALVALVFGPDPDLAADAVAEILRRSGIPIVSPDGPVIGLPDHLVLADGPIYAAWATQLANQIRAADGTSLTDFSEGLMGLGYLPEEVPGVVLGQALAQWGKDPTAPMEAVFAASVVRDLSGRRGDVFTADLDADHAQLDPLQTTLLLSHILGDVYSRAGAEGDTNVTALAVRTKGAPDPGPRVADVSGPCEELAAQVAPRGDLQKVQKDILKDAIKDAIKNVVKEQPAGGKALADEVGINIDIVDKSIDVVALTFLLMGARLELTTDHGDGTHFKHGAGNPSKHVQLTATATFNSSLDGSLLDCYALAGLKVPPNGPLTGFRIAWAVDQAIADYPDFGYPGSPNPHPLMQQGKYLAVASKDASKVCARLSCGQVTGKDGTSTVELYPPVEKKPGVGGSLYGDVKVRAALSKEDVPAFLKVTDAKSFLKAQSKDLPFWLAKRITDLAVSFLKRAGLPSQELTVRVGYHGRDIYTVKGSGRVFLFYYWAPFHVDLYTCTGLANATWKGKVDFAPGITAFGDMVNGAMAKLGSGVRLPSKVSTSNPHVDQTVSLIGPELAHAWLMLIDPFLRGSMTIDAPPPTTVVDGVIASKHVNGTVGDIELYIGNQSLQTVMDALYSQGSAVIPVVGVPDDPRCPQSSNSDYYFENY